MTFSFHTTFETESYVHSPIETYFTGNLCRFTDHPKNDIKRLRFLSQLRFTIGECVPHFDFTRVKRICKLLTCFPPSINKKCSVLFLRFYVKLLKILKMSSNIHLMSTTKRPFMKNFNVLNDSLVFTNPLVFSTKVAKNAMSAALKTNVRRQHRSINYRRSAVL